MKLFILSLFIVFANISNISAEVVDVKPTQVLQTDIVYSYQANEGDILNDKTFVKFDGKGLGTGISRGRCRIVLSKSPNLDNFSECYYYLSTKQISITGQGIEKKYIFPTNSSLKNFYKTTGYTKEGSLYYIKNSGNKTQLPNGKYYQYMILSYNLNPAGSFTIIKEASNKKIEVVDGILYATNETGPIPDPEPEPVKKFDLSVESITISPTSNSIDGDIKASVTIKNNGNKVADNCCVRFFLSKYNTVYKPYQYLFSTVFKLGSLDAGKSTTHEETLKFLSQSVASPGAYYVIADVYSSTAEKEDSDDTNNQKATPFTMKSGKSLNIINNRSSIQITNITEESLGNTIFITGSNARSIKEIPINTTNEINITNNWSDPILFITIISKDGNRKDIKINNSK